MKKLLIILPFLVACDDQRTVVLPVNTQPQIVQPVPQPVVIQEPSSNVGSFVTGAAIGALAGHVGTNLMNQPNKPAMDMSRLSSAPKPMANFSKPTSKMNMSKLSSYGKR